MFKNLQHFLILFLISQLIKNHKQSNRIFVKINYIKNLNIKHFNSNNVLQLANHSLLLR